MGKGPFMLMQNKCSLLQNKMTLTVMLSRLTPYEAAANLL